MGEKNYILSFTGYLSSDTIDSLINQFKQENAKYGINILIFKKLISVIIETLENIYKYSRSLEKNNLLTNANYPIFNLELSDNQFIINAGNLILNSDINDIKRRIESIKGLDAEGLKNLYIDTIKNGRYSTQGGAGLGLIKIARVSENNIEYKFDKIDTNLSYYTLKIKIRNE